ncbi:MAG: hypothetical protein J5844_01550, partial [Clostridia bacterium]|nr:hypothetical protein [Clostridia bacterium]
MLKRRITAGLLALFMCFTLMPVEAFSQVLKSEPERIEKTEPPFEIESDYGVQLALSDSGEEAETVKIGTAEEFAAFASRVNGGENELNAELTADIDFNDYHNSEIGDSESNPYNGTFDGKGFSIKIGNGPNCKLLFYYIGEKGVIKDLTVCGTLEIGGSEPVGIAFYNYGLIEGCLSTLNISGETATEDCAGGVVERNYGTIRKCVFSGSISVKGRPSTAGGIAAYNYGTIESCRNDGNISAEGEGSSIVGGIAGDCSDGGIIKICQNAGEVSVNGKSGFAGGIAGTLNYYISDYKESSVENCYNTGNVRAEGQSVHAGGITGGNMEKTAIRCCFNYFSNANVTASGGDPSVGSIVGHNYGTAEYCYGVHGLSLIGNGNGASNSAEMEAFAFRKQNSFPGFDFDNVWTMVKGFRPFFKNSLNPTIIIRTADDFAYFVNKVNGGQCDLCAVLKNDIDVSEKTKLYIDNQYNGIFDGKGHSITVGWNDENYCGLFRQVSQDGRICNLTLVGSISTNSDASGSKYGNLRKNLPIVCGNLTCLNGFRDSIQRKIL